MAAFDPAKYLDAVDEIVVEAGRRILDVYEGRFDVSQKQDGSPLTAADEAAHAVIVERLAQLTPRLPVLSEESAETDYAARGSWERFWLVDPLDGTKEFVNRNGEFTVNIALIERGIPVLGVVHVPVKQVTYRACAGGAASKRDADGTTTAIRVATFQSGRPRVVASRSHADATLTKYLDNIGEHDLVSLGSSLKFCLVAEGKADVYPRLAPTMEWDTGAAQCIVEVAGGRVLAADGSRLRYNKESLRNPWILTCGGGTHDWLRFLPAPGA
jgi:3'(2'), 5'-bisphosphate nucleotidase